MPVLLDIIFHPFIVLAALDVKLATNSLLPEKIIPGM